MQGIFKKIKERVEKIECDYLACDDCFCCYREETIHKAIDIINQVAEEYSNVTTCYLQSPCEYQNKDVILPGCEWIQDNSEYDVYDTKCGNTHMFIDGSPSENEYKFCPYCGKEIKVVD